MGEYINEQGNQHERLYVVCDAGRDKHGKVLWLTMCDCGEFKIISAASLRSGRTKSCGCIRKEMMRKKAIMRNIVGKDSPNFKHGETGTRLMYIWSGMKTRCNNSKATGYEYYGARGIKVCPEWSNDFMVFKEWAETRGYANDLTIDRINSDGNYEPDNCQWITQSENSLRRWAPAKKTDTTASLDV